MWFYTSMESFNIKYYEKKHPKVLFRFIQYGWRCLILKQSVELNEHNFWIEVSYLFVTCRFVGRTFEHHAFPFRFVQSHSCVTLDLAKQASKFSPQTFRRCS